jgi:hypothetical protein
MKDLAFLVFPHFEDDRINPVPNPPYSQKLLRNIGSPIEPIRPFEQFLRLFKSNTALWILPEPATLPGIEVKTVIPLRTE